MQVPGNPQQEASSSFYKEQHHGTCFFGRTRSKQSGGVGDQPQCRGLWHSCSPSARSFSRSPSPPPPSLTESPSPPRSLVSSTIPLPAREQLCNRYCSNKHTLKTSATGAEHPRHDNGEPSNFAMQTKRAEVERKISNSRESVFIYTSFRDSITRRP
jgi:hypothetical protein